MLRIHSKIAEGNDLKAIRIQLSLLRRLPYLTEAANSAINVTLKVLERGPDIGQPFLINDVLERLDALLKGERFESQLARRLFAAEGRRAA